MKKYTFFLGVFLLILPWILTSCEKVDLSSEMEKQNVKITTRATTSFSKEDFPISIYALDNSGKKVAEQTLNEGENNTIYGTELLKDLDSPIPLMADMSSDILSRPVDVSKYAVIYGGAQKNLSMAGVTFWFRSKIF